MKVRDITSVIEEFAPLGIQESWDNGGLCIGSPDDEVHGVLVGFDCTPELIAEAIRRGLDMVVTHHPLIFGGLKRIVPGDPVSDAVSAAIRGHVAVYASHTSADKVIGGVSGAMARRLGLEDIRILDEEEGGVGLGAVGELPRPMEAEEALEYVKKCFSLKVIRSSRPVSGLITRVAMCGGSGGSLIGKARASGAKLYISGDISYHNFFTPEGFMVADIGHFEGEVEIVDILFSLLTKKFPNFATCISEDVRNSNPIHYF